MLYSLWSGQGAFHIQIETGEQDGMDGTDQCSRGY
ncbi:hypothetical protein ABIC86_002507 [Paenibacillus sp. DS2363]